MKKFKIRIRHTHKWFFAPVISRNCGGEIICQTSVFFLCFEFMLLRQLEQLVPGEAVRKYVTAAGYILCTESDERDKAYVINRSRGFEMTYGRYEIVLKNGTVHVYRSNSDEVEHESFESQMVNVNDSSI